jgi:hypothetical protein
MDPGENGAIFYAVEGGGPDPPGGGGGERAVGMRRRRSLDVLKMLEGPGDRLGTTSSPVYAQSMYHMCIVCEDSLRLNNYYCERCLTVPICSRRINHIAVTNHLHTSSSVREVVLGTLLLFPTPSSKQILLISMFLKGQQEN